MSYIIRTASNVVNVQVLLDKHSTMDLVGYSINKDGQHCLIFKEQSYDNRNKV